MSKTGNSIWLGLAATMLVPQAASAQTAGAQSSLEGQRMYILELTNSVDEACGVSESEARLMAAAVMVFDGISVETSPRQTDLYAILNLHIEQVSGTSELGEAGCAGFVSFNVFQRQEVESLYDGLTRWGRVTYCEDTRFVAFDLPEGGNEFYDAVRFSAEVCLGQLERNHAGGR